MTSRRRVLFAALVIAFASAALLGALDVGAETRDWKAMRSAGQLGERYDGFLEARDPTAAAAAAQINKARRDLYQKRATELDVSLDQVGRIYFKENLGQLPTGTWIHLENGDWIRK